MALVSSRKTAATRCGAQKLAAKTNSGRVLSRNVFTFEFGCECLSVYLLSYICGANIMNYSHFGPRSCPLYDNEVPLHMRHEREVREAEAEAVARLRAKHPEIPEAEYKGTKNGKK